ncbi:hypothetical protein GCM10007423_42050 [Dyadobacter endophyticus]|uniref:Uncharacterized protein n=1 Tax=Dyadobacter endophyticus TaxID=1749036 RepID=A0ABQ1Z165_9BACT|nr:hypothetical protein GCM10007423_42050 [Dyadobacter endophyticus]
MRIFQIHIIRRRGDIIMVVSSAAVPRMAAKITLSKATKNLLMNQGKHVGVKLISYSVTFSGK